MGAADVNVGDNSDAAVGLAPDELPDEVVEDEARGDQNNVNEGADNDSFVVDHIGCGLWNGGVCQDLYHCVRWTL